MQAGLMGACAARRLFLVVRSRRTGARALFFGLARSRGLEEAAYASIMSMEMPASGRCNEADDGRASFFAGHDAALYYLR